MAVIIEIQNRQKRVALNLPALTKKIQVILKSAGVRQGHLVVVFVTDRIIQALNLRFLKEDGPTDVLAFDMLEETLISRRKQRSHKVIEGEIVVSVTTAFRQAKDFKTMPAAEILLYVIHGILHLLGYDDQTAAASKIMRVKEQEWLARLGGPDPVVLPARHRAKR